MVVRKLLFLLILLVPVLAVAAVPSWQIVPMQSTLSFTATQNGAPVTGKFKNFSGDISFDPAQLNASHIKIMIDMNSVSAADNDVSSTLKTADWFNVKLFPQAVFTADKFVKTGANAYQANGNLTIRDKTLPVTVNFVIQDYAAAAAHAKGSATIKRTQFGIGSGEWANTDSIKDDVQINFALSGVKKS